MTPPDRPPLRIEQLDPESSEWRHLVATGLGSSPVHHPDLVATVAELDGLEVVGFGARQSGELVGGMVVAVVPGDRPRPKPLLPLNGPVVAAPAGRYRSSRDRRTDMVTASLLTAVGERWRRPSIRLPARDLDLRSAIAGGWYLSAGFTFVVDIADTSRAWHHFDHDRRRLIRRAESLGYRVVDVSDAVDADMATTVARLHGDQARSFGAHQELDIGRATALLPPLAALRVLRVFMALDADGTPVATQVVAVDGRRAINLVTGIDERHRDNGVNGLLRWRVMQMVNEDGVQELDLNGARIGPAGRFKASFGSRLEPVWSLTVDDHTSLARLLGAVVYRVRTGIPYRVRHSRLARRR